MPKSRRDFLAQTSFGLLGAAVVSNASAPLRPDESTQEPTQLPPGAPPAFGTGPAVGPEVSGIGGSHLGMASRAVVVMQVDRHTLRRLWRDVGVPPVSGRVNMANGPATSKATS